MGHPGWCANLIQAAGLRPGEPVIVVVDEPLLEQGAQLEATVADAGGQPRLEVWSGERPLEHAPPAVLEAAEHALVSYILTQKPLAAEGGARFELLQRVTSHRGRQIFMGFVDAELLAGQLSEPAPDLTEAARRVLEQIGDAETIRLTSPAGTDLTLRIAGRGWHDDVGPLQPGTMANFPGGEVYIAPLSDGADGVLVIDVTIPYTVEGLVDEPVTMRFERGRVTSIEGGRAADLLRGIIAEAGTGADVVAELGIGLNHTVTPIGNIMLDEKAGGTAHVAIGRNTGPYGGDNEASIHVDCVFSQPTIEADGRLITL
jgi:leucyl aminopeptidase (aminopeptidase T)